MPRTTATSAELNGTRVDRSLPGTIRVPLPAALWRPTGSACHCPLCNGRESFWDALAVSVDPLRNDTAWTVHAPELTGSHRHIPEPEHVTDPVAGFPAGTAKSAPLFPAK